MMTFGSVCSGIEAASVAWRPLGWKAAFVSEIDKAASAVLAHHYPDTPNFGDMTKWETWPDAALDVLVGGTPCQSFSVAGLRKGLDDPRGSLMLVFGAIARRYCPRWIVWENVPGVLSSNGGRDFGAFLGMLGELGYGFAYRVLDAQFFGLAQRRARVFVVGYLGDWRPPAAVLFERESLRGDSAPRREAGQRVARPIASCAEGSSGYRNDADTADNLTIFSGQGNDFEGVVANTLTAHTGIKAPDYTSYIPATWPHNVAGTLDAHYGSKWGLEDQHINAGAPNFVTHALTGEGFDASEDGTGRSTPLVPVAFMSNESMSSGDNVNISPPLRVGSNGGGQPPAIAFSCKDHGGDAGSIAPTLRAMGHNGSHANAGGQVEVAFTLHGADKTVSTASRTDVAGSIRTKPPGSIENSSTTIAMQNAAVRRLTPRECERLQGFPDDYTAIPYRGKQMADGPRYKMLGNSMAVPVMAWIGERIALVDGLKASLEPTP